MVSKILWNVSYSLFNFFFLISSRKFGERPPPKRLTR